MKTRPFWKLTFTYIKNKRKDLDRLEHIGLAVAFSIQMKASQT